MKWISILCILSFVLQSMTVQLVQGAKDYYKPFFLMYIAHGSYILFFPTVYGYFRLKGLTHKEFLDTKETIKSELPRFGIPLNPIHYWKRIITLTLLFSAASLFWYFSVSKIPIGDISAIYNTSCFFVYVLSVLILKERFMWTKLAAVIISIIGIGFISLWSPNREFDVANAVVGYSFAVLSSVCAAMYEVLYSMIAVPKTPSMFFSLYVTGSIGLVTLVLGLLAFPIFHWTGVEIFELPPLELWPYIGLISLLGMAFNSLFLLVITFSGPVFAAVAILISIPLTSIVDYFFTHHPFSWNIAIGSLCIFVGFYLLQRNGISQADEEAQPLLE
jgi:drug/metabolite transporter (DMT)-like permease